MRMRWPLLAVRDAIPASCRRCGGGAGLRPVVAQHHQSSRPMFEQNGGASPMAAKYT